MSNFYINPDDRDNKQNNNAYYNQFTSIRPTGLTPDYQPNIKYHEDILSENKIIKNSQIEPTHHSASFMDFIALILGNKENYGYYPIFSNGSKPDFGNSYGLASFVYNYINNFITNTRNTIFGLPEELDLDPNQLTNYMLELDGLTEQYFQEKLANLTSKDILRTSFEVLYDPDRDLLKFIGSDAYYGESNE